MATKRSEAELLLLEPKVEIRVPYAAIGSIFSPRSTLLNDTIAEILLAQREQNTNELNKECNKIENISID